MKTAMFRDWRNMAVYLLKELGQLGGCAGGDAARTTPVHQFLRRRMAVNHFYAEVLG